MNEAENTFHVFLSHRTADKPEVERIAHQLEERGITAFLDKWHLIPGEPWQEALEEALSNSLTCAVFLGSQGIGPWENEEMRSALEERVRNKTFRVIPVLLPGADVSDPSLIPRFLRRLTWIDFRKGLENADELERFIAGILGHSPGTASVDKRHIDVCAGVIHALPPAPSFIGRAKELAALRDFWDQENRSNVISLIGLGGAGKTAIAAEFLSEIMSGKHQKPDGLFVWSFYVDQDANNFLRTAYQFFSRRTDIGASGLGLLYLLADVLSKRGRTLLVLDGLERVQKQVSDFKGLFGELEDPLLKQILSRLALGIGDAKCLITSRFPVADLSPWQVRQYTAIDIDQLEPADARTLLRKHRVKGSDLVLDEVVAEFGAHALTLDHLATYLAEFCNGDPAKAHELEEPRIDSDMREERKLARVLYAYEHVLTPPELDLLMRYCIFRAGVSIETICQMFGAGNVNEKRPAGSLETLQLSDFRRLTKRLVGLHLLLRETETTYTAHPAVRDHFYRLVADSTRVHGVVEKAFTELLSFDIQDAWTEVFKHYERLQQAFSQFEDAERRLKAIARQTTELAEVIKTFIGKHKRILPEAYRQQLEAIVSKLVTGEMPEWPGYPSDSDTGWLTDVSDELELLRKSYFDWHRTRTWDSSAAEAVLLNDRDVFVGSLQEFSRRFAERVQVETASELVRTLEAAKKRFDFSFPELRLTHARLRVRPGISYPEDPAVLDLLEELIYHSIKAGNIEQAFQLYNGRLGGLDNLGKTIGEYVRGVRVMRSFPECPNKYDLAWYLRGIGDLKGAADILREVHPIWVGTLLCLQGYLSRVADDPTSWSSTLVVARFLCGRSKGKIERNFIGWGEAVIIGELYLLLRNFDRARHSEVTGRNVPEVVRKHLVVSEIERLAGNLDQAHAELDRATQWILRSGSVEHLCLFHLVLARILIDEERFDAAQSELREGLHLAKRCGFNLYSIDLLTEKGRLFLKLARRASEQKASLLDEAATAAMSALNGTLMKDEQVAPASNLKLEDLATLGAQHPECQYVWGEIEALCLLAEVLVEQGSREKAAGVLQQAIEKQVENRHPGYELTKRLLADCLAVTASRQ